MLNRVRKWHDKSYGLPMTLPQHLQEKMREEAEKHAGVTWTGKFIQDRRQYAADSLMELEQAGTRIGAFLSGSAALTARLKQGERARSAALVKILREALRVLGGKAK